MCICNYIFIFNHRLKVHLCLLLALLQFAGCSRIAATIDVYWVIPETDTMADVRWADYLSTHLNRRAGGDVVAVMENPHTDNLLKVLLHVDRSYSHDYSVTRDGNVLHLVARDDSKMLWLIYQFMSAINDKRIDVSDLPPAMIKMDNAKGDFAFEYRGIYTLANSNQDMMSIMASHNVDYDWGLWGHNLQCVFTDGISENVRAVINGQRNSEQFCFSSEDLYNALVSYVVDNYGEGETEKELVRFAIMPNDNDLVCMCPACKEKGNTSESATPAVTYLLRRLADRFPNHLFFTSAYLSTYSAPSGRLPSNAGVIISAMDIPMRREVPVESANVRRFSQLVNQWRRITDRVYVWDYMRNFDDYLTPYPCLNMIGKRLRYFLSLGVSGVFFNGSGPDYASFDDVQTVTLANMLINPELNIDEYLYRCICRYYPISGQMLAENYICWEHKACSHNVTLPFYGGIADAVKSWLDPGEFELFCHDLDKKSKAISDEERIRLNKLLTALQFTRLELQRMPHGVYDHAVIETCLESLQGHGAFDCMHNYREVEGSIDRYIEEWESLKNENSASRNSLRGVVLTPKYEPDEDYQDMSVLTDGFYALPSDYHTGWLIASSDELSVEIPSGKASDGQRLKLSFMYAPRWRIVLPDFVEVWQSGKRLSRMSFDQDMDKRPFMKYRLILKLSEIDKSTPFEVRIMRNGRDRCMVACDEIELY